MVLPVVIFLSLCPLSGGQRHGVQKENIFLISPPALPGSQCSGKGADWRVTVHCAGMAFLIHMSLQDSFRETSTRTWTYNVQQVHVGQVGWAVT